MWRERLSPGMLFKSLDLRAAGAKKLSALPDSQGLDGQGSVLVRHEPWAGRPPPGKVTGSKPPLPPGLWVVRGHNREWKGPVAGARGGD